ncbi:dihydrodipicolinate synthase family protein [Candidatus Poribacteria bacterium]|nr:dihydrodipicolinate synthase family protein [Candidatus Poribacteria bacterium]
MPETGIWLPTCDGSREYYIPRARLFGQPPRASQPATPVREVDAAVHIVINPDYAGSETEFDLSVVDWTKTAEIREHIWNAGLGVADGMDTAQRDILPRGHVAYLLQQTAEQANGRRWYFGAGTDDIRAFDPSNRAIAQAYIRQVREIQSLGGKVAVFPTPYLAGRTESDFVEVYSAIDAAAEGPLLAHWLGEMFNARMRGYFPGESFYRVMELPNFESAKISLLDEDREIDIRRRLAALGKIVKTGDDYHYVELIEGTDHPVAAGVYESSGVRYPFGDFSHALLGCMSLFEDVAEQALNALAAGDIELYRRWLLPTVPLSYWVFQAPTAAYKHGVATVAMLRGKQENDLLLPSNSHQRGLLHRVGIYRLMDLAGLFTEDESLEAYRRHIEPHV